MTTTILAASVAGGLLSPPGGGSPVIAVERASSQLSQIVSGAGTNVWWAYAFTLGAVAAFNPCGFGLLPAYLGLYLNGESLGDGVGRVRRALVVGVVVAGAFTILFGVTGALFSMGASLIVGLLPWLGVAVGVALIVAGGVMLSGGGLRVDAGPRVASRLGTQARAGGVRGYAAFGVAYGLASLGCTLPLFLALLGTSVATGGPWGSVVAFTLYGSGMATTLTVVALIAAIAGLGIVSRIGAVRRVVPGLGAVLLLASGAYVVYYWLSAGRILLT